MTLTFVRLTLVAGTFALFGGVQAWGEETNPLALAKALDGIPITLEEGLKASEIAGKPISAKFEIEDGKLQLSVYVVTADGYAEAIVSTRTGVLMSAQKMTDPEDLEAAGAQSQTMRAATVSLRAATEKAAMNSSGARVVSVVPEPREGQPAAKVTLLAKGALTSTWQRLQ